MKARLVAVQRTLVALILASLALSAIAFPHGRNREYMAALEELKAFRGAFHRQELEQSLLSYAQKQGVVGIDEIAKNVKGPGVPTVHAATDAAKILPRASVTLGTLGEVLTRASGPTTLPIGVPSASELGAGIAWRLSRMPDASAAGAAVELRAITLAEGAVSDEDLARERNVAKERVAAQDADRAFDDATQKLNAANDLYDARRKWKASWKMLIKADEGRKDARAALAAAVTDRDQKQAAYERDAKLAESFVVKGADDPAHSVANVRLAIGKRELTLLVPITIETRSAALPQLGGIALSATRAAGLWDDVQGKTAADAIEIARSHFTWHYRYVELGGMKLGGMTLLHVLPAALPIVLFLLLLRIRRVSVSYNPFGAVESAELPRVGLGPRALDAIALAVLPFAAAILTIISLTSIGEIPVLPLIAGFLSLGLGAYVFVELGALRSLTDAVARSHSTPPPPKPRS